MVYRGLPEWRRDRNQTDMKTRRLFLKLVVGLAVLFPFLKTKPARKFITSAHRSEIIGLHWLWPNGDEWKVVGPCPDVFNGERILNQWGNKFLAEKQTVGPGIQQALICFEFDPDGICHFPRVGEVFKV